MGETFRGVFVHHVLKRYAEEHTDVPIRITRVPQGGICIVASFRDYQFMGGGRRTVLVEHGAGQTYSVGGKPHGSPSNPGGRDREGIHLFVCPNDRVARLNAEAYPNAAVVVAGSPRVDALSALYRLRLTPPFPAPFSALGGEIGASGAILAIAHHWPNPMVTESGWAWPDYYRVYPRLLERYRVLGHAHPRAFGRLVKSYEQAGITPVERFEDILDADVLLVDNSSVAVEWAAVTGKPLVWLNSPRWRKGIHHGLRFWEWPQGQVQVDRPGDLLEAVERAIEDSEEARISRQRMVGETYAFRDGRAAHRAVETIERFVLGKERAHAQPL